MPPTNPEDPEAPYGRKADGTPKQPPGPKKGSPQRGGVSGARASKSRRPDYRPAVGGLLQLVSAPLLVLGNQNELFLADAAALSLHAPPIVEAINDLAQENPQVARILDSLARVGPYGALLTAVVPLCFQIAVNHKALPLEAAQPLGAHDPRVLINSIRPPKPQDEQVASSREPADGD